jgi:hypothetical protein
VVCFVHRINQRKVKGPTDWTAEHTSYIAFWKSDTSPFLPPSLRVTEPHQNEGFIDQDQLERFLAKQEHNQHMISIQYHILSLSNIIIH